MRRVPKDLVEKEGQAVIWRSLETDSVKLARQRRDICAVADEQRWNERAPGRFGTPDPTAVMLDLRQRALAFGFTYTPIEELVANATPEEIVQRVAAIGPVGGNITPKVRRDADALLGTADVPKVRISQALELYLEEIALDEQIGKSPEQFKNYSKVKRRAIANFIRLNGDMPMTEIGRDHARKVYRFWADRIQPKDDRTPMSGNSANWDLGNLRKLYRRYFEHMETRTARTRSAIFASLRTS